MSKSFILQAEQPGGFLTGPLFRKNTTIQKREKFTALENISFELNGGDILGIIGENGSGKTTLLNIISGIIKPTSGNVECRGRVHSILELGTGFHPDLSGRQNIFLNASLLGIERKKIKEKLEEIIDFSEIGKFLDVPVKFYSTGMYLRLAFSVSLILDADILLMDEIITVGDASFRQKSFRRLLEKMRSGISVVMVSHNLNEVAELCTRCIRLSKGKIIDSDDAFSVTRRYYQEAVRNDLLESNRTESLQVTGEKIMSYTGTKPLSHEKSFLPPFLQWRSEDEAPGNDKIRLLGIGIKASGKNTGEPVCSTDAVEINTQFKVMRELIGLKIYLLLNDQMGNTVFISGAEISGENEKTCKPGQYETTALLRKGQLNPGMFSAGLLFMEQPQAVCAKFPKVIYGTVSRTEKEQDSDDDDFSKTGLFNIPIQWTTIRT